MSPMPSETEFMFLRSVSNLKRRRESEKMTLAYIKEVCISQVSFQNSAAFLIWWNAEPDDNTYVKRFLFEIEIDSILLVLVLKFYVTRLE